MGADIFSAKQHVNILRKQDVLDMVGISNSTLYLWMATGHFPKPIKLGPRAVGWPVAAVQKFLEERPQQAS